MDTTPYDKHRDHRYRASDDSIENILGYVNLDPSIANIPGLLYNLCASDIEVYDSAINSMFRSENGPMYGDAHTSYVVNSYGHRSPEFEKNVELVTAGCSQTFGVGVPMDAIWVTQLANSLNNSYANLAIPGWSTQAIVANLFAYFKKYGNPKKVVVLLPDLHRMMFVVNKTINKVHEKIQPNEPLISIEHILSINRDIDIAPKLSMKPHRLVNTLSSELPFLISMQMLNMLIQYCNSSGIILRWSTWDGNLEAFLQRAQERNFGIDLTNYVKLNDVPLVTYGDLKTDCHLDLVSTYGDNFYTGLDSMGGASHMGVHAHTHIAEGFLASLTDDLQV